MANGPDAGTVAFDAWMASKQSGKTTVAAAEEAARVGYDAASWEIVKAQQNLTIYSKNNLCLLYTSPSPRD